MAVAVGGALGSVTRHGVTVAASSLPGGSSAAGTLIVNILGCAAIGALGEFSLHSEALPHRWVLALRVGFLGGLTTVSSFAAASVGLWSMGRLAAATAYVLANLVIGLAALLVAAWLVRVGISG